MPDRITADVQYAVTTHRCPACDTPLDSTQTRLGAEDPGYATTIAVSCGCGYQLRWVCRAACCAGLPPVPDEDIPEEDPA
jgi:hypothetical protein